MIEDEPVPGAELSRRTPAKARQVYSTGRVIILPFCKVIRSGSMLDARCCSLILKLKSQPLFKSSALRPIGIATPIFLAG
jgi:hypothetical protein